MTQKFQLQNTGNSDSVDLACTITEFTYDAENGYTFNAWFSRWHDTFQHEFPDKDNNWKKQLLIQKLGTKENQSFVNFILPKRPSDLTFTETIAILTDIFGEQQSLFNIRCNCFKIAKNQSDDYVSYAGHVTHECERFHLQTLTEDQFKCLIFIAGLHSPDLVKLETDEKVTVQGLTAECNWLLKLRKDTMLVQQQSSLFFQLSQVSHIHSNKSKGSIKIPPSACWSCDEWHYARFCPFKKHKCQVCHKRGHKENFCHPPNVKSPDHQTHSKSAYQTYKKMNQRRKSHSVSDTFKVDFESHRKYISVSLNKIPVRFQFDTSSDITLIFRNTWTKIG